MSDLEAAAEIGALIGSLSTSVVGVEGAYAVELAVVEVLNNLALHGYPDKPGPIEVEMTTETNHLVIEILDQGQRIPEVLLAAAGPGHFEIETVEPDWLEAGGMGLSLIVMCMDRVEYFAGPDGNLLRMVRQKRL